MSLSLSRRALLKSLGFATAATVPVFRAGVLHAQAAPSVPKRFVSFVHFCGTMTKLFFPDQAVADAPLPATLPQLLTPLDAFKSKLLVVKGLKVASAIQAGGSHTRGMVTMLSGHNEASDGKSGGQTIDHHIGNTIGGANKFRSLQFAVRNTYGGGISWTAANQSAPPMQDPYAAFDRLFGGAALPNADPAALEKIRQRRQSVFDHVAGELSALAPHLSTDDRARVDVHLSSVREVEKRLQTVQSGAVCTPPTMGNKLDYQSDIDAPAIGRLHADLIAAAFSCDLTRSVTMQWSRGTSTMTFPHLSIPESHHNCSHLKAEIPDVTNKLAKINLYYAEQFAYLLGKLDKIKEADGKTMLDHTIAWWSSEVATGGHALDPMVCVLAGGGQVFRMGRSLVVPTQPHNTLLMSIANAMGAPVTTFGEPDYCKMGPLNLA